MDGKRASANRPVRIEDVAREAGVSPITVSRALSYPDKVKEETRRHVAEAVAKTGYVLNSFASSLRSGRSTIVTVFISSLQNPHFASAIQGTIDAFEGSRFHLMFAQTGYSEALEIGVVNSVLPFRPAGVMFTGVVRSDDSRAALQRLGIPIMELFSYRPDPIDMLVGSSGIEGGRLMGEHFGTAGFKRIAYCGHAQERGAQRLEGFRAGLAPFGLEVSHVEPMEGTRSISDGIEAFDAIVAALADCDSMFFGTDVLAIGASLRARQRGIAVPTQIAIAGYGDLDLARHMAPSLTTVGTASYQMGLDAGKMLLRRLNDETVDTPIILHPVSLEVRDSTRR